MDLSRTRISSIVHRLPPPLRRLVVNEFNRLYYATAERTWQTTKWMGADVWKPPTDLWVMQEILWDTKPDLLIETGIHLGGSSLFFGDLCRQMDHGRVIAIDIDLTNADKRVFEHPRIEVIEGSSVDPDIAAKLRDSADGKRVMVNLDSDHSADHVQHELDALGPLVSEDCYLIVEDTNLNGHPITSWPYGDGPMEALERWHPHHPEFVRDEYRERLMLTFNPKGYLKRRAG